MFWLSCMKKLFNVQQKREISDGSDLEESACLIY